jgi:hypothetical protein
MAHPIRPNAFTWPWLTPVLSINKNYWRQGGTCCQKNTSIFLYFFVRYFGLIDDYGQKEMWFHTTEKIPLFFLFFFVRFFGLIDDCGQKEMRFHTTVIGDWDGENI